MNKKNKAFKSFLSSKRNLPIVFAGVAILGLFIFFVFTMIGQNADINRMERQRDEIAVKVEAQNNENEQLQAVLDSDNKDDYIEQVAREKGYVKSNEIVFYDISSSE